MIKQSENYVENAEATIESLISVLEFIMKDENCFIDLEAGLIIESAINKTKGL